MKYTFYLMLAILLVACENQRLEPAAYVQWVEDEAHQLCKKNILQGVEYLLQYQPLEYVVANEERDEQLPTTTLQQRKKELEGLQYFKLRMQSKQGEDVLMTNLSDPAEYDLRVNYYSFDFKHDIYLVEGADTLQCRLFHFVRSHGIAPYVDFVMAFDQASQASGNKQLVLTDRALANNPMEFNISKEAINNIPEIITY